MRLQLPALRHPSGADDQRVQPEPGAVEHGAVEHGAVEHGAVADIAVEYEALRQGHRYRYEQLGSVAVVHVGAAVHVTVARSRVESVGSVDERQSVDEWQSVDERQSVDNWRPVEQHQSVRQRDAALEYQRDQRVTVGDRHEHVAVERCDRHVSGSHDDR